MPDYEHWARQSSWKISEASALLTGIEPDYFESFLCGNGRGWGTVKEHKTCCQIYETLKRDKENVVPTNIYLDNPPLIYIKWALDRNFEIPDGLQQAITKFRHIHEKVTGPDTPNPMPTEQQFDTNKLTPKRASELVGEPLWFLYTGILYLHGLEETICPDDDKSAVKRDSLLKKHYGYAIDSFIAKKLNLIEIKDPMNPDWVEKTYKVAPDDLLTWSKTISYSFRMHGLLAHENIKKISEPPRSYCTQEMQLMYDAVQKFWVDYNLENPDSGKAPFKKKVVAWLKEQAKLRGIRLSDNLANAMDTIMRCPTSRQGGNTT